MSTKYELSSDIYNNSINYNRKINLWLSNYESLCDFYYILKHASKLLIYIWIKKYELF